MTWRRGVAGSRRARGKASGCLTGGLPQRHFKAYAIAYAPESAPDSLIIHQNPSALSPVLEFGIRTSAECMGNFPTRADLVHGVDLPDLAGPPARALRAGPGNLNR